MKKITFLIALLFSFSTLMSQIKMPTIFHDGMVLQRDKENKIWGMAEANKQLTLSFAGKTKTVYSDVNGNFTFYLSALEVSSEPQVLKIEYGSNFVEIKDVLVGDVFLLSGQSNMAWRIIQLDAEIIDGAKNDADYPNIRYYTVAKNFETNEIFGNDGIEDVPWVKTNQETVLNFSAVGFYFGRKLYKDKQVPLGLIDCCQGSSNADAWISLDYIEQHPELVPYLAVSVQGGNGKYYKNPGVLYEKMLSRILPYTICGVLWYQGEANAATYQSYPKVLPAVIDCFRNSFHNQELPFVIIQLSAYENTDFWPYIREIQDSVATVTPHTVMVSTIDVGDAVLIHPRKKEPVGERCALAIRNIVYGESNIVCSGPSFKSINIEGNKAVIAFDYAEGLKTKYNILNDFEICDTTYIYKPITNAEISENMIYVWNTSIASPVAARYAWSNFPSPNLYNSDDLPANPFRTSKRKSKSTKTVYYVSPGGSGLQTGHNWENSLNLTSVALKSGKSGDEFWVKTGEYQTNIEYSDRILYGGFDGTETEFSQRNWVKNPTVIKGIENAILPLVVVRTSSVLDGFIIQDNHINDTRNGSGIQLWAKGNVRNCIIRNNSVSKNLVGGGVFVAGSETNGIYPTIENCLIINNEAANNGGAVQISASSSLHIINSTIANNMLTKETTVTGSGFGCGIGLASNSKVIAENCIIYNNRKPHGESTLSFSFGTNKGETTNSTSIVRNCAYDAINIGNGTLESVKFAEETTCINDLSESKSPSFKLPVSFMGAVLTGSDQHAEFDTADYDLLPNSVCVDVGNSTYVSVESDLAGNRRFCGKSVDLGAYEYDLKQANEIIQISSVIYYYINHDTLILTVMEKSEQISVYNVLGREVYTSSTRGNSLSIVLPSRGLYVVKTGKQLQKIMY